MPSGWKVRLEHKGKGSSAPPEWSGTGVWIWQIHWIHLIDIFWAPAVCQALCCRRGGQEAGPGVGHRDMNPEGSCRERTTCAGARERLHRRRDPLSESLQMSSVSRTDEGHTTHLLLWFCRAEWGRWSSGKRQSWVGLWAALTLIVRPRAYDLTL